jgi:hypothetical protein
MNQIFGGDDMDINTSAVGTGRGEEGKTTRAIEKRTSRAPSGVYLALAIGSMVASAAIMISDQVRMGGRVMGRGMMSGGRGTGIANFVGQWAPTLLIMGLYNKVVKLERELTGTP